MLRRPRPRKWSRLSALSALRFASAGRAMTSVPLAFLRPSVLWLSAWVD